MQELGTRIGLHPTKVPKDLRRFGFQIYKRRSPSGQWMNVISDVDAKAYLKKRSSEYANS